MVWITKYRKKVLTGILAGRVPVLIRGICKEHQVEILKADVSKDHVHLFVSVPPHLALSKVVQYLKGKSSYKLLSENKDLSKAFWGRHLWGRRYFVATSGNVTDQVSIEYIQTQDNQESDDDFTIVE
jgi:putative transposase